MSAPIVKLAKAKAGDRVRVEVSRRGVHGVSLWSKTHVAVVDHEYGAGVGYERRWVRPICGAPPGRAMSGSTFNDQQCKACARVLAREGRAA